MTAPCPRRFLKGKIAYRHKRHGQRRFLCDLKADLSITEDEFTLGKSRCAAWRIDRPVGQPFLRARESPQQGHVQPLSLPEAVDGGGRMRSCIRRAKLGLAFFVAALVATGIMLASRPPIQSGPKSVTATVTRVGLQPSKWAKAYVVARAPAGQVGTEIIALESLRCQPGDRVDGRVRGTTLRFFAKTCRRPA